jgi:hypothetical protein
VAASATAPSLTNVGFLTVLQEPNGYLGGYLVTNQWGRPLEFRLTSAVQPNKVQQILYGDTLLPYLCSDLIGKTLIDKASVAVQLLVTDREAVLDLRVKTETPIVHVVAKDDPAAARAPAATLVSPGSDERGPVLCHPQYPADAVVARDMLARIETTVDLSEPFARIREAIAEARKMGVTRAA